MGWRKLAGTVLLLSLFSAALLPMTASQASETIRYIYDAKGRVVRVERTGTVNNGVSTDYSYDRANNRRRVLTTGSANLPPP